MSLLPPMKQATAKTGDEAFVQGGGLLGCWLCWVGLFYFEFQSLQEKDVGGR